MFFETRSDSTMRYTFYIHHILLSGIVLPVFWLNSLGQSSAARIILILALSSVNFFSSIIQSQPYRTEFYFLCIAATVFVLFIKSRIIFILFAFNAILFAISIYNIQTHNPSVFNFDLGLIIRIVIAFTFLYSVLYLMLAEGRKNLKTIETKAQLLETERNEVLRANFTKDRVLSVISHDLRGPINSLKGLLTILSNDQLSQQEFQLHAKNLNKQVSQLQLSLEELLSWSRSQSTNLEPQPEEMDTETVVEFSLSGIRQLAEEKNIQIQTDVNKSTLFADPGMTRSIFTNLLTNAIKFTHNGGKISISTNSTGATTSISIADTGVGIPEENLKSIFDGNYTTPGTNNEKGTGIGLSLCNYFIAKNKGSISVKSKPTVGTVFIFKLPATKLS